MHLLHDSSRFADIRPIFASCLLPAEEISIRDHAEKNLYLPAGKNPFPGLVSFEKTPYLYEPLEALMPDNGLEKVVIMKGWQTGGTLTGLAWALWVLDIAPTYMLIVLSNDELRKTFSQHRIDPLIAHCKSLRGKIEEASKTEKIGKDSILTKSVPNGCLFLGTALSSSALRSHSFQNVMFDEVSAYPASTGKNGDPCGLAIGRTSTYEGRKKLLFVSTPSLLGQCRIQAEYLTTDQRKFFVPCLGCGHMQLITEEGLDYSLEIPVFRCEKCRCTHHEQDKTEMLRRGEWRPTAKAKTSNAVGYHLPALYAPPGMWSWRSTREQWMKGQENPEEMKVYFNNCLGLPYEDAAMKPLDPKDLRSCIDHSWPSDRLPKGIGCVTLGLDTHPDRLDIAYVGHGREGERWIIDHQKIFRDPNDPATWLEIDRLLGRQFVSHYSVDGKPDLRVGASCLDTGGHNTGAVYEFCRGREDDGILPIKGTSNRSAPVLGSPTLKKEANIYLWPVGKLATHGRLFSCLSRSLRKLEEIQKAAREGRKVPYAGPGLIHFHPSLSDQFYKELTAPKGKWVRREGRDQLTYYTASGTDDHAHDCLRYADAAWHFLHPDMDWILTDLETKSQKAKAA